MAKPTRQPRKDQQRSHVRTRAFASAPTTVSEDGRSFDVTIYTEHPVRTHILDPRTNVYIEADEILLASGLDLSQSPRMPLVNNHDSHGDIRKTVLGRVDDIRAEGQKVVGRATLSNLHKDLAADIAEGFLGNISATYYATDYEVTDRPGNVPLAVAHRTILLDASMVPVGADPNASVRGTDPRAYPAPKLRNQTARSEETTMDELEQAVVAAEEAIAALDEAIEAAGEEADAALLERARRIREIDPEALEDKERGERNDDEELTVEEQKAEDEEIRKVRSIAASYGLTKTVDDLVKLGARAKTIRAKVRSEVLARGAAAVSATSASARLAPSRARSADADVIDTRSVYERRNKRS